MDSSIITINEADETNDEQLYIALHEYNHIATETMCLFYDLCSDPDLQPLDREHKIVTLHKILTSRRQAWNDMFPKETFHPYYSSQDAIKAALDHEGSTTVERVKTALVLKMIVQPRDKAPISLSKAELDVCIAFSGRDVVNMAGINRITSVLKHSVAPVRHRPSIDLKDIPFGRTIKVIIADSRNETFHLSDDVHNNTDDSCYLVRLYTHYGIVYCNSTPLDKWIVQCSHTNPKVWQAIDPVHRASLYANALTCIIGNTVSQRMLYCDKDYHLAIKVKDVLGNDVTLAEKDFDLLKLHKCRSDELFPYNISQYVRHISLSEATVIMGDEARERRWYSMLYAFEATPTLRFIIPDKGERCEVTATPIPTNTTNPQNYVYNSITRSFEYGPINCHSESRFVNTSDARFKLLEITDKKTYMVETADEVTIDLMKSQKYAIICSVDDQLFLFETSMLASRIFRPIGPKSPMTTLAKNAEDYIYKSVPDVGNDWQIVFQKV